MDVPRAVLGGDVAFSFVGTSLSASHQAVGLVAVETSSADSGAQMQAIDAGMDGGLTDAGTRHDPLDFGEHVGLLARSLRNVTQNRRSVSGNAASPTRAPTIKSSACS
jgi:hypothetical protein